MKISTAFLSEIGGREKNEDTVCIRQKENNLCVFVGDGLGGYDGGKIASLAAAETVMKHWGSHGLLTEMQMQAAADAAEESVKRQQENQIAVLMGEVPQEGIRFHADRNRVLRALGSGNAKPDISPLMELKEDTAFLLCTDGFWEYVYEREMEETLKEAREPADWLEKMRGILEKRSPEGNDNFSAAAVFCKAENVCRRG